MKPIKLSDPIYNMDIRVVVNVDSETYRAWVRKEYGADVDTSLAAGMYSCLHDGSRHVHLVWVGTYDDTIENQKILAHEVLHLAIGVLGVIGLPLNDSMEESLTYYFTYLLGQCWEKLAVQDARKKKK